MVLANPGWNNRACRRCGRRHRTWNALARCLWPHAAWVWGEGPVALLARCNVLTITLWPDLETALPSRRQIDSTGCGSFCRRRHEFIGLDEPDTPEG
jgi:hypothetical protein